MDEHIKALCEVVRETGFALHKYLRAGHLESVYEKGLQHRLTKQGLKVQAQHPLQVHDEDGMLLGDFRADLFVENCLIIEIKACSCWTHEHFAQVLSYLCASRVEHGLLMNFGAPKFQVRKFAFTPRR